MSADAIAAELASAMLKDTDVGKVVLGASFVDDLLSHLIQTRLIDDEVSRKLFSSNDTDRPFGLSVKSRLTFALGLISKSELDDISKLAKARNQVAHLRMSELLNNKDYKKKTLDPLRDISLSEREQLVAAHKEYLAAMQVNALVLTWTLANRVAENSSFLGPTERAEEIALSNDHSYRHASLRMRARSRHSVSLPLDGGGSGWGWCTGLAVGGHPPP